MKTVAPSLKVLILGAPQVGKSAVAVRFLTRRFIGEYSSGSDCSYQTLFRLEDVAVKVDLIDSASQWDCENAKDVKADAIVIVYSIIDHRSLKHAQAIMDNLHSKANFQSQVPVLLLGNKTDLEHLRQVSSDDVTRITQLYECRHCEISAAESCTAVGGAMQQILREGAERKIWRLSQVKRRKSLLENVSRRLGSVFRRKSVGEMNTRKRLPRVTENINRRSV